MAAIDPVKLAAAVERAKAAKAARAAMTAPVPVVAPAPVQAPAAAPVVAPAPPPEVLATTPVAEPLPESETQLDRTNPAHAEFLVKLRELEAAMLDRDPLMKTHLAAIHRSMQQHDDITVLLTAEEISKIITAQQQHTGVTLVASIVKSGAAKASKKAAGLGMLDL
jgi:hypothetical protein